MDSTTFNYTYNINNYLPNQHINVPLLNLSTNVYISRTFTIFFTLLLYHHALYSCIYMYFCVLHASTRGQSYNKPWNLNLESVNLIMGPGISPSNDKYDYYSFQSVAG